MFSYVFCYSVVVVAVDMYCSFLCCFSHMLKLSSFQIGKSERKEFCTLFKLYNGQGV